MKKWFSVLATTLLLAGSFTGNAFAADEKVEKARLFSLQAAGLDEPVVIQEQEPNNTFEQANEITSDAEVSGTLEAGGEIDYYKVQVTQKGLFFLFGGVESDTEAVACTIYDANFNEVAVEDGELEGNSFYAQTLLNQTGTYYIKVTNSATNSNTDTLNYGFNFFHLAGDTYRIAGTDRYDTAVQIAYEGWADGTDEIILATGQDFPDALAAAPLAYSKEAPILLTKRNELPATVEDFILNSGVSAVTIVGGTGVVSQAIENYLRDDLGLAVTRIGGKDRFETAAKIAPYVTIGGSKDQAFVVNGRNFPDALSIAPVTAYLPGPILLTDTNSMPAVTANAVKQYQETYVVGGTGVVSDAVLSKLPMATRIAGQTRYDTSVAVAQFFTEAGVFDPYGAFVTTGENFPDAIAASALSGYMMEPIILTKSKSLDPSVKNYFETNHTLWYTIIGGTGAVSADVEQSLRALIQ